MKNPDLTTIISGVLGLALIAMAALLLLYEPTNIVFAASLIVGALGLNGYNAALMAPSPKQGEQIAQAVAAAAPQVPLVSISHPATNAPDIQVSSSAIPPVQRQGPQPIVLPQPAPQPMSSQPVNMPPPQQGQVIPFPQQPAGLPQWPGGSWQAQPSLSENSMPLSAISRSDLQQQ